MTYTDAAGMAAVRLKVEAEVGVGFAGDLDGLGDSEVRGTARGQGDVRAAEEFTHELGRGPLLPPTEEVGVGDPQRQGMQRFQVVVEVCGDSTLHILVRIGSWRGTAAFRRGAGAG
eukprot:scaffold30220_cov135-Isochrysis_galbana.AAC.3